MSRNSPESCSRTRLALEKVDALRLARIEEENLSSKWVLYSERKWRELLALEHENFLRH